VFARRSSTTVGALVPERLEPVELTVVDTNTAEWQGFPIDYLGVALPHIPLVDDPGTGMMVAKMTYPAGHTTPWHTHPCAHGIYVLAGTLNTHQGFDPSTGGLTHLPGPTHPRLIGRRLPKQLLDRPAERGMRRRPKRSPSRAT
jgi:anti-sigma factor ChrR (cupin superfamily)